MPIPALIGAGASLVGGLIGNNNAAAANRQQVELANQNATLQRQFAEHSIQWRTEDAYRSGIHPLYALGAQTHSFSPVSIGHTPSPMPQALAAVGQDVSRAVQATRNQPARDAAYAQTVQDLTVQRMGLENQLLASQIAKVNQAGGNPPMPTAGRYLVDGQAQSGVVQDTPMERIAGAFGALHQEPGAITDVGFARTNSGYTPVPSKDVKERIEDMVIPEIQWTIRNNILPSLFGAYQSPPKFPPKPGYVWRFNWANQEYQQVRRGSVKDYLFRSYP